MCIRDRVTTYRYNTKNQLMQENDAGGTKDYAYDHRGNLLSVTSGAVSYTHLILLSSFTINKFKGGQ